MTILKGQKSSSIKRAREQSALKVDQLNDTVMKREINAFKTIIATHVSSLLENFLPESTVGQVHAELVAHQYDSVIQSIIEKIFQYARGDIDLQSEKEQWMMKQACDTICRILWKCPSNGAHYTINWTQWVKTPLGFAIKACYARLKDTLTCEELGILLGYTRQEISRRAKLNILPHQRVGGSYVFSKKELMKHSILPQKQEYAIT
ncbi:MAG: hypothetical protein RBU23_07045 [Candidatus Auribacterota bacterium]|jgi:hypothetical protein|nr:hypothetical protein [Candidatus Auribacterota bacterium]